MISVIPGLMDLMPFLNFSKWAISLGCSNSMTDELYAPFLSWWVMSCNFCESRTDVFCGIWIFSKWVIAYDYCESRADGFCVIFVLQQVSANVLWFSWVKDSGILDDVCSTGSEWCSVIVVISGLMDSVLLLFFRLWVMSCDYCDSRTDVFCVIFLFFSLWVTSCDCCKSSTNTLWTISVL